MTQHVEPQHFDWHEQESDRKNSLNALSGTLGVRPWVSYLSKQVPPFLVPGLLQSQALHVLSSDTGCCKSWLGLSLMLSGVFLLPVLDQVPSRAFSSIYLAADSPDWDIQQQLRKLLDAYRIPPEDWNRAAGTFIMPIGMMLDDVQHVKDLTEFIKEWDIDVLFIDVMLYSHSGNENDNAYMARHVLRASKYIRDVAGCAVFFIHHNAKPRPDGSVSFRGAGTIVQAVEHHFSLTKHNGVILMEREKIRGDENEFFTTKAFSLARAHGGRYLQTVEPPAPKVDPLLEYLGDGPKSSEQLAEKFPSPSESPRQLENKLMYLQRKGSIIRYQLGWKLKEQ